MRVCIVNIKKQYNSMGKEYISVQKKFFSIEEDKAMTFIKKCLPNLKNKVVLDLGCGNGKDMIVYELLGTKEVYGVDSSKIMIADGKKKVAHPENLFVAEIEKLPFKNNFFDLIVGRFSLHYLDNFDAGYKEIARVLKPKGVLILVVDHPLMSLMMQKKKIYGQKEIIQIKLYDDKIPIHFPSHTFNEYFSKTFFDLFSLKFFEEGQSPERKPDKFNAPDFMGFQAMKK
jgi:ubiquinone/menaquinone biosynthesis C-methylase UbiE